jgi:hypothetical protein
LDIFFYKVFVHEEPEKLVLGLELIVLQKIKDEGNNAYSVFLDDFELDFEDLVEGFDGVLEELRVLRILNIAYGLD